MMNEKLVSEQTFEQKRKISIQDGDAVKLRKKITIRNLKENNACVCT
jgi:hypothetical protein